MDLRYQSPAMRRKNSAPAPAASPMDEAPADETMDERMHQDEGGEDQGNGAGSAPTTILPKALGGGKDWKEGQEIVLKIVAIDPESGDMQVKYAPEKGGESDEAPADSMEAMDSAMPEEKGGY